MRTFFSFLFLFSFFNTSAQDEIFLENPSFEGFPKLSRTPDFWFDCGFPGESQVDIHPVPSSEFMVDQTAIDGATYLGMVTRENDTWEAIGQRLSQALLAGKTYTFSIHLSKSVTYVSSLSPRNSSNPYEKLQKINFATPIKLRIWGGNGYCQKVELLAESPPISNTDWQDFAFTIQSKTDIRYILFEAFYETSDTVYNGNILVDNASSFLEIVNEGSSIVDSIKVARLNASNTGKSQTNQLLDKKGKPTSYLKGKNKYIERVFSQEDKAFFKEQLALVKFVPDAPYLEEGSAKILLEIIRKVKSSKKDLEISFNINTTNKNLNKKRGREILSFLTNEDITLFKVNKSIPAKNETYFRGGYGDIYMCIY